LPVSTTPPAEREIRQHTLLYAEQQLLKSGEYEAVAAKLVRRSVRRLVIGVAVSAWLLFAGVEFWVPALITTLCVSDFVMKRATQRRIRELAQNSAERSTEPA